MNNKQYLIGSKLLNLENETDTDYFILDDSMNEDYKMIIDKESHIDYFYRKTSFINKLCNFEIDFKTQLKFYSVLYQYDADIIGQNFPIEFHVLEHKTEYINFLNYVINENHCGFGAFIRKRGAQDCFCVKEIYHIAYVTYILKNNSTTLTAEQQQIIQTIHDKQMPISYLDELKKEILAL